MVDRKIIDDYLDAKMAFEEAKFRLFPHIQHICDVCGFWSDSDVIEDVSFCDDNFMMNETYVSVHVDYDHAGRSSYQFPARYLDMADKDIKAEIERKHHEEWKIEMQKKIEFHERKLRELRGEIGNGN